MLTFFFFTLFRLNKPYFGGQQIIIGWHVVQKGRDHAVVHLSCFHIQFLSLVMSSKYCREHHSSILLHWLGYTQPWVRPHCSREANCDPHKHTLTLHKYMHIQTHTLQESILINAGLALNTEGLSEPLILPLHWRVCACMCIREIGMGRANSVTAVSGFHRRACTHVFPQCEGC